MRNMIVRTLPLIAILAWAAFLRLHGIDQQGLRFTDEGYYLMHPMNLAYSSPDDGFLYYKHGLCLMLSWFVKCLGAAPATVLTVSAVFGIATVAVTYLIVRQIFDRTSALAAAALVASMKYIVFYNRSNLSDGYALLIFATAVALLAWLIAQSEQHSLDNRRRARLLAVASGAGLVIGFSFTVRIQTCLTLFGMVAVMVGVLPWYRPRGCRLKFAGWYAALGGVIVVFSAIGYGAVMGNLGNHVDWPKTLEWYGKNFAIAQGETQTWGPYLFDHIGRHTTILFPIIASVGVALELRRISTVRSPLRIWLLVCFLGLFAAHVLAAMPWPRGQLNLLFLLAIYWGAGLVGLVSVEFARKRLRLVLGVAVVTTIVTMESVQTALLFKLASGYDTASAFMVHLDADNRRQRHFIGTHSWPITACSYGTGAYIAYELTAVNKYGELCAALIDLHQRLNVRFVVLDLNVTYFAGADANRMWQEFVVTNLPDLVVPNDIANEAQCVADAAWGRTPRHDIFSSRIMVYDLDRLVPALNPALPYHPYTNDMDMTQRFETLLSQRGGR